MFSDANYHFYKYKSEFYPWIILSKPTKKNNLLSPGCGSASYTRRTRIRTRPLKTSLFKKTSIQESEPRKEDHLLLSMRINPDPDLTFEKLTCLRMLLTHSALSLSGKYTQEGRSSTFILQNSLIFSSIIWFHLFNTHRPINCDQILCWQVYYELTQYIGHPS